MISGRSDGGADDILVSSDGGGSGIVIFTS